MKKPIYKRKWFIIVIIIIFIALISSIASNNSNKDIVNKEQKSSVETDQSLDKKSLIEEDISSTEDTDTKEEIIPEEDNESLNNDNQENVKVYKAGTYKAGTDIPSGEYLIDAKGILGGYFETSKDSSGSLTSIIANDNITTHSYITINDGEYLKLQDATATSTEDIEPFEPTDGKYQQGMYKVGVDISAGEYKVIMEKDTLMGTGYYEIASDSSHSLDSIVVNDNFQNNAYVNLEEGQYIKLTGAYIEVK